MVVPGASNHAVAPEHVLQSSAKAIAEEVAEVFKFDGVGVKKHKGTMKPFVPCCLSFGGLCRKDNAANAASVATFNMHSIVVSNGLKGKLPLMIKLQMSGVEHLFMLVNFVGVGQLAILLEMEMHSVGECSFVAPKSCGDDPVVLTSHRAVHIHLKGIRGPYI